VISGKSRPAGKRMFDKAAKDRMRYGASDLSHAYREKYS
jgi:hypothetical protein